MPDQYQKFDTLPHVIVADRLRKQGKTESELLNHFIEYVICQSTAHDAGTSATNLANKAYSPDELLHSKGNLRIDIDWYSSQQLLPPITRLIEHIDGIEVDFVAQCLGVDPKKYRFSIKQDDDNQQQDTMVPSAVLKTETFKSLEDRAAAKLKIVCPGCGTQSNFPGVVNREKESISGLICSHCKEHLPLAYLKNRVKLAIKQLLNTYFRGKKYMH